MFGMKMQISVSGFFVVIGFPALLLLTWRVLFYIWFRPKRLEKYLKQQGLEGTPYKLLVGDALQEFEMVNEAMSRPISLTEDMPPRVLPFLLRAMEKYGKNCYRWLGPLPMVTITNPEAIKDVFNKVYDFPKLDIAPLKLLLPGLPLLEGDIWAKRRKILNPAFHQQKLQKMVPAFYQSCSGMIKNWEEMLPAQGSSCELDVWPHLLSMTSDAIARSAFGSSFEEGRRIFQLQDELAKLVMQTIKTLFIPGWRFIPTKTNKRVKQLAREIRCNLKTVIENREQAMEAGDSPKDDLLGILLESSSLQTEGKGMSIEDIIEECQVFYFAGQETTAVLLVWTLVLLSQHQDWQSKAREEIFQVFHQEKPDFDRLNHLKVVTMILHEVLRFYPPIVHTTRSVEKETKVGDLTLPAGVAISIPILLIHRDPELWGPDANEFNPDRFADGVSKATTNPASFLPFTAGPRVCIGMNFALVEAKMALTLILQRYWFELSPCYTHAPFTVVALRPQSGAHLILHKL